MEEWNGTEEQKNGRMEERSTVVIDDRICQCSEVDNYLEMNNIVVLLVYLMLSQ